MLEEGAGLGKTASGFNFKMQTPANLRINCPIKRPNAAGQPSMA
jgi:hypothetical protein